MELLDESFWKYIARINLPLSKRDENPSSNLYKIDAHFPNVLSKLNILKHINNSIALKFKRFFD